MHVVLYVLDALRYDHLGCYGYSRDVSPNIDAIAHDGVLFENCFTATTWTRPVAATILTGTYPAVHQTRSRQEMFSTPLARLPEVLKTAGFKTAAFCTMGNIASDIGFGRGFDKYYDLFRDPGILVKRRKLNTIDEALLHASASEIALPLAEDVHEYLFPWLEKNKESNTFSLVWSIETHVPYTAPAAFRRFSQPSSSLDEGGREDIRGAGAADAQRLIDLYDDEISYNDHCIGQIVDHLKMLRIYDETLFIILGDHGEAFYEHGVYTHGHAPYEEVIHVPLIMKLPYGQNAGGRIQAIVELIDIYPTVIEAAGIAHATIGKFVQGHSLLPLVDGTLVQVRDYAFSDTQTLEVHNRYFSVRGRRWKYIQLQRPKRNASTIASTIKRILERRLAFKILRNPRHFLRNYFKKSDKHLFDLISDPDERVNLAAQRPDLVTKFRRLLIEWQVKNEELATQIGDVPANYKEEESLRQHLEKLGYL